MKRLLKTFLYVLVLLFVGLISFFFWGSASEYPESEYSELITYDVAQGSGEDSTFSIITYNIGYLSGMLNNEPVEITESYYSNNLASARNSIEKIEADIICFQEIDYASNRSFFVNQQDTIAELGYKHGFKSVNWDKRYVPFPYFPPSIHFGKVYSGQSILSKFPISEPERIVLEKVESDPFYRVAFYIDRLAQVCQLEIGSKKLILINVHLEAYDTLTREHQCDYLASLYEKYRNEYPVLLVGDFNSDIRDPKSAIQRIVKLEDIGMACKGEPANTFPSDKPVEQIDYIFYNKKFITELNSEVLTSFGQSSDHLPVFMEFALR